MSGELELDFSEKAKGINIPGADLIGGMSETKITDDVPLIFGKVVDFKPVIKELKVYKGDEALFDEAEKLNNKFTNLRTLHGETGLKALTDTVLGQGLPLVPFPEVQRCLGLSPRDSTMQINEGYAVMGFDYRVTTSSSGCLFNMKENLYRKEERAARKWGDKANGGFAKMADKLAKKAEKQIKGISKGKIPSLDSLDFDIDALAMGVEAVANSPLIANNPMVEGLKQQAKDALGGKEIDIDGIKEAANKFKEGTEAGLKTLEEAKKHGESFMNAMGSLFQK